VQPVPAGSVPEGSIMTASLSRPRPSRPRPAVPSVPPVQIVSAPWAAALAEPLTSGRYEWVMGEDGALVPVACRDAAAATPPVRRGRLAGLLRR
jgi:hypothetical protein